MADTVKIGCSMPNGIVLDLDGFQRIDGENRRIIDPAGPVTLRGLNAPDVQGRYAYTEVDAGFWNKWLADNKESPLLRDGVIFAMPSEPKPEEEPAAEEAPAAGPPAEPATTENLTDSQERREALEAGETEARRARGKA